MPELEQDTADLPSEGKSVAVEIDKDSISSIEEDSGEHEEYSAKVQKRIDKLTKKAREAERQQQAAIAYAQGLSKKTALLKGASITWMLAM